MKAYLWLPVFFIFVATGCATTQIAKKEKVEKIRKLAEAYLAEEKYVPAYRELMTAIKLDPKDPHIHYALGIFYYKREKYDRAIESYQKALELKHDFATARNNLGIVYMEQQEWDKAIETLACLTDDYLYATPHFPHFLIGQAYFHKQDYQLALEHFQASRELEPDFPYAVHWLGKTYLAMEKPDKAVKALDEALKLAPAAAFMLDLGRAYFLAGNFKQAKIAFGKAASLATDDDLKSEIADQQRLLQEKTCGKKKTR